MKCFDIVLKCVTSHFVDIYCEWQDLLWFCKTFTGFMIWYGAIVCPCITCFLMVWLGLVTKLWSGLVWWDFSAVWLPSLLLLPVFRLHNLSHNPSSRVQRLEQCRLEEPPTCTQLLSASTSSLFALLRKGSKTRLRTTMRNSD